MTAVSCVKRIISCQSTWPRWPVKVITALNIVYGMCINLYKVCQKALWEAAEKAKLANMACSNCTVYFYPHEISHKTGPSDDGEASSSIDELILQIKSWLARRRVPFAHSQRQ